jgi:hypothetical protein
MPGVATRHAPSERIVERVEGPVPSERRSTRVEGPAPRERSSTRVEGFRGISGSILDTIGNTPLVRINAITRGVTEATVLA